MTLTVNEREWLKGSAKIDNVEEKAVHSMCKYVFASLFLAKSTRTCSQLLRPWFKYLNPPLFCHSNQTKPITPTTSRKSAK